MDGCCVGRPSAVALPPPSACSSAWISEPARQSAELPCNRQICRYYRKKKKKKKKKKKNLFFAQKPNIKMNKHVNKVRKATGRAEAIAAGRQQNKTTILNYTINEKERKHKNRQDIQQSHYTKIMSAAYFLKHLRDQGMPRTHLNTVLRAIILAKITYTHYQPGEDFLLSRKLDGSIPFLSELLNMVCAPSCSRFWIWLMMLTKHCLTVCLKTTLSPSNSPRSQDLALCIYDRKVTCLICLDAP